MQSYCSQFFFYNGSGKQDICYITHGKTCASQSKRKNSYTRLALSLFDSQPLIGSFCFSNPWLCSQLFLLDTIKSVNLIQITALAIIYASWINWHELFAYDYTTQYVQLLSEATGFYGHIYTGYSKA